ncbi:radical SAM protein [Kitasatospora purpeofusca]
MPVSVIDGLVVSSGPVEINLTTHCNLRCRACSHLSPAAKPWHVDVDVLAADLEHLSRVYRPAYLRLLGGEPLLHNRLIDVLKAVRGSGIADTVQMCSNGLLLERADDAVWDLLDELELSIYPVRGYSRAWLDKLREIEARGVRLKLELVSAFRESYTVTPVADPDLVARIHRTCMPAHEWLCHTLHEGVLYKCPQSVMFHLVGGFERAEGNAGVDIRDFRPSLTEDVHAYLTSPDPLGACSHCFGSVGVLAGHVQKPRRGWLSQDQGDGDPASLVDMEFLGTLERNGPQDDGCTASAGLDELAQVLGIE